MLLPLVCMLFVLALLLRHWRWRWTAIASGVLALAVLLLVGCGPATAWLLAGLQDDVPDHFDGWKARNAIVLLGAGTVRPQGDALEPGLFAQGRINAAVRLYRQCKARGAQCRLEISGGDALGLGESEASAYRRVVLGLGVPEADLMLEPRSMNTWQNAQFSRPLLKAWGAEQVVLVSSATHLHRASLYFRHFGIDSTPVRGDWLSAQWSWLPRGYDFAIADVALHEYLGIAHYRIYQALGWNVEATRAGAL